MKRCLFHFSGLFVAAVAFAIAYGTLLYLGQVTMPRIGVFLAIEVSAATALIALVDAARHLPPSERTWRALHSCVISCLIAVFLVGYLLLMMK